MDEAYNWAQQYPHDPVFQKAGKWFFADEVWADVEIGPYATEAEARAALVEYMKSLG